jgi:heat-inducible transcriptional repressor
MTTPVLTDRQRRILRAIVEDYIATAEPVGSRTISRHHLPEASPATIRNDMADLEALGLLEQPHTSAGRVPSDHGYRYYIDEVLEDTPVPGAQARLIEQVLGGRMGPAETLAQTGVRLLSETSSLISIVLGPQFQPASLVKLEIGQVGEGRILLALVSDAGFVETRLVEVLPSLGPADLARMAELVNSHLEGRTWEQVDRPGVIRDMKSELHGYASVLDETIEFLQGSLQPQAAARVYVHGLARLLDLPEFQDLTRTKAILSLLDSEQSVLALFAGRLHVGGVTVTIGRENKCREMADCSLVSAPFRAGGRAVGGVAVLGPKRMAYGQVVPLVDLVAASLDELMGRLA